MQRTIIAWADEHQAATRPRAAWGRDPQGPQGSWGWSAWTSTEPRRRWRGFMLRGRARIRQRIELELDGTDGT